MKKLKFTIIFLLFAISAVAQEGSIVFGAGGNFYQPVGSLGDRFNATFGGSFFIGKQVSDNWAWTGKLEYYKFTDLNDNDLTLRREVDVAGEPVLVESKLTQLEFELEIIGLSANANYKVFGSGFLEADFKFGFGVYRWFAPRGAYNDTLTAASPSDPNTTVDIPLVVSAVSQIDWSGGLNLGLEFNINVVDPVSIYLGADYKIIIAEIWPALDLGLENISSFQMFNAAAGIKVKL